jgi:hypothetical protein
MPSAKCLRSVSIALVLAFFAEAALAQMADPILALSYDPAVVKLPELPRPHRAALGLGKGTWWVFASYADPIESGTSYGITSGLVVTYSDSDPPKERCCEPDFGVVYKIVGTNFEVLGVPDGLFDERSLGNLPRRVIDGLLDAYTNRLVTALGGQHQFVSEFQRQRQRWKVKTDLFPKEMADRLGRLGVPDADALTHKQPIK